MLSALLLMAASLADSHHEFDRAEWNREAHMNVRLETYRSHDAFREAARQAGVRSIRRETTAFSQMSSRPDGLCTIHVLDPTFFNVRVDLGHELMHCAYGRWHR